jgi:hypothetical protein
MPDADESAVVLTRRELIQRVSALLGGVAFVGGSGLLAACERARTGEPVDPGSFSQADIALLDEIAETILPETSTPGAKAAATGAFMARMVTDCYSPEEQRVFRDGMRSVDEACRTAHQSGFLQATPEQRLAVITQLDREQHDAAPHDGPPHYFRMMKELALLGFFTSEIGYTRVQRYVDTPGRYDPDVPYRKGEPAWVGHV